MVPSPPLALRVLLARLILILAGVALLPPVLLAQATPTVRPDNGVYAFIDRLVAARLVDTVIVGQRTMSRREIGRIIAEARARAGETGWLAERLREYAVSYPDSIPAHLNTALLAADARAMDSPPRGIEPDANGAIDAGINPLAANQLGRPIANGSTLSYEVAFSTSPTSWLTAAVRQRESRLEARGGSRQVQDRFDELYVRTLLGNVAVTIGRDNLFLGQGNTAGLIASLNPRTIDQVRIASDAPFVLPGLLRHVGPMHATLLLGDLGKDQYFPHTRFLAYKVSSRPHPRFEIGASLAEQVGGQGAQGGTFLQKAGDAFPLLDALFLHRNFRFSNKFVGVDIRYSIPGVRGAQFYAEGVFDDFDLRRVRSVFTEDAGYVWGISTSCFGTCGPVRASAEYHVTGLRFYTHGDYRNGFTVDRLIIGDQLGPRGKGAYGSVDVDGGRYTVTMNGAYEARSGNKYGAVSTTPDDSDFRFVLLEHHPTERRWRAMTTLTLGGLGDRIAYHVGGGVERVENFAHADGAWRTNWMARLGFEVRPIGRFF